MILTWISKLNLLRIILYRGVDHLFWDFPGYITWCLVVDSLHLLGTVGLNEFFYHTTNTSILRMIGFQPLCLLVLLSVTFELLRISSCYFFTWYRFLCSLELFISNGGGNRIILTTLWLGFIVLNEEDLGDIFSGESSDSSLVGFIAIKFIILTFAFIAD